jgi:hypothetical protein
VFSFWHVAHRPTRGRGFLEAAALKDGNLDQDIGGATCLLSTVVFNALLLAGFEIVERRCHSVDSYGERRYFELGRDATIEYGYIDLRMRNVSGRKIRVSAEVTDTLVMVATGAAAPAEFGVVIEVGDPSVLASGFSVGATRRFRYFDGRVRETDSWNSAYKLPTGAGKLEADTWPNSVGSAESLRERHGASSDGSHTH